MNRTLQFAAPLVLIGGLLVAWEVACRTLHIADYVLPSPIAATKIALGDGRT